MFCDCLWLIDPLPVIDAPEDSMAWWREWTRAVMEARHER